MGHTCPAQCLCVYFICTPCLPPHCACVAAEKPGDKAAKAAKEAADEQVRALTAEVARLEAQEVDAKGFDCGGGGEREGVLGLWRRRASRRVLLSRKLFHVPSEQPCIHHDRLGARQKVQ